MLKVKTTEKKITPFGGISFVIHELEKAGIPQLIDSSLPKRHGGSEYKYSDAVLGLIYGIYCGADRLEDLATLKHLMIDSSLNIPSPDQLSKILRLKLTAKNDTIKSFEASYSINVNAAMNNLLMDVAVKLGALKPGKSVVTDYDNTIIECQKEDAFFTYKKTQGYQPGVCLVGDTPVYIEGMNGNNPAAFDQENTLKRAVAMLESKGVKVRRFRADSASYQPEVVKMFDREGCDFFLRATNSTDLFEGITDIMHWKEARLGDDFFEIGSFEYVPFKEKNSKVYRVVTTRRPADKPHHITGKPFVYRSIITNNRQLSDVDVVWTYNQRGFQETVFTELNDFSWCHLPFSYMSENTTFMLVTAMGFVMYNYLLKLFSSRVDFIQPSFRLKAFRFNAINVSAEWCRDTLLIHDKSRPWEKLAG